ncbi:MAG: phosphoserine phosphatase [Lachnospiraceae bacterium]|nr:phosphoserine phosphatase [Lachnospiraceae bacterium]
MSDKIFLFDLDCVITQKAILPTIAEAFAIQDVSFRGMEGATGGEMPFKQSFLQQVEVFKRIPVREVCKVVEEMPLNEELLRFIQRYHNRCYIVTEYMDVWICELIERMRMRDNIYCSEAEVVGEFLHSIYHIIDRNTIVTEIKVPYIAVGNSNNASHMIELAEVGVGYGGVRTIAPSVLACASHVIYDEFKLVEFLERLV